MSNNYTIDEAAKLMGLNPTSLRRLIKRGVVEAFLPPGMSRGMRISEKEVERWRSMEGWSRA